MRSNGKAAGLNMQAKRARPEQYSEKTAFWQGFQEQARGFTKLLYIGER